MENLQTIEFCGRLFEVSDSVASPYMATEFLVFCAIDLITANQIESVLDVGTGCGNIAVTLLKQFPNLRVLGTDISIPATAMAVRNAQTYEVADRYGAVEAEGIVESEHGDYGLIIANVPYLPKEAADGYGEVFFETEPRSAYTDEGDGLSAIRRISEQASSVLSSGGYLLVEYTLRQIVDVVALFSSPVWTDIEVLYLPSGAPLGLKIQKG